MYICDMKVKTIRKKILDKKWVNRKYLSLLEASHTLSKFKTFDCDTFFRGELLAAHNLEIYNKRMFRLVRKIEFLKKYL